MSDLQRQIDAGAWSVPEGWTAERIGRCTRCHDTVLWATTPGGSRLKFDRNGEDHFISCTDAPRQGVGRSWKGQRGGSHRWETK